MNKLKYFTIFFLLITFSLIKPSYSKQFNYYADLVKDWPKIFPDQNRNAAGPKFFKHILSKKITYQDFIEYNKLYCAVSGSLIDPNSEPDFLLVKEKETNQKICGNYYKCCVPCSCDIMKYSEVQKMKYQFNDGIKEFFVFTIKNPCNKDDFPNRVNKDYFCNGDKINTKQVFSLDNRIVIGLLHNAKSCKKEDIDFVKSHPITGRYCELRNNTPLDNLQTGMGDIFIKLAR